MQDEAVLREAAEQAIAFLETVNARHVGGTADRAALLRALGGPLPERGLDPRTVIQQLATAADPGLVSSPGPRYFGFVTGGSVPAAVAADWLVSAWDQNGAMYAMSPAVAVLEDIVGGWILDVLGLPSTASVGFVTGAHMANFTCLAAARHEVLRRAGWNVEEAGLQRAPALTVFVGDEVHVSVVSALRMLGIGARELVRIPVDGHGRMQAEPLALALLKTKGPAIVCVQAGNVATGATDPLAEIVAAAATQRAWVHVDGAFGLWAAAVPSLRDQLDGVNGADSWTTDAHKWLNVPYDSGLAIVKHPAPHRAAMGMQASYLERGADEQRIGMDWVPESSRRARVVPLYAMFRTLGRAGLQSMVVRTCALARRMADRLAAVPDVRVLNEIVLNQVLVHFTGGAASTPAADAELTRDVITRVQAEGTCWAGGAVWQGTPVMRISVSNWSTTEADVARSADAIIGCLASARSHGPVT
jgi:glutamate/tyrosine decarboxylase-like PLP-dependent enzyme